jgi:hypothetical protein
MAPKKKIQVHTLQRRLSKVGAALFLITVRARTTVTVLRFVEALADAGFLVSCSDVQVCVMHVLRPAPSFARNWCVRCVTDSIYICTYTCICIIHIHGLCVCVFAYIYICIHMHMHIHIHMHTQAVYVYRVCMHMHTHTHTQNICGRSWRLSGVKITHMQTHTHTKTHTNTHTHTHTHTHTPKNTCCS